MDDLKKFDDNAVRLLEIDKQISALANEEMAILKGIRWQLLSLINENNIMLEKIDKPGYPLDEINIVINTIWDYINWKESDDYNRKANVMDFNETEETINFLLEDNEKLRTGAYSEVTYRK